MDEDRKTRMLGMLTAVLDMDAITDEDENAIVDICLAACRRKNAEATEDYLVNRIDPTPGSDRK